MSVLSIIAFITGTLGVWLTIRQSIWCWPVSLISVVTSAVEFFSERLYGDMSLQGFYFAAGLYGWIYWQRAQSKAFVITKIPPRWIVVLTLATLLQFGLYYLMISHFGGDRALLDALLTACSLSATYMMTRKWVENWAAWVLIDGVYVVLYLQKKMWLFAVLYLLFSAIAYYGWMKWKKQTS